MAWENAWQQSPWLGAAPSGPQTPTVPGGPVMPGWMKTGYGMGEGRYASPINEPSKAPSTATGQIQARELAGMFGSYGAKALGKTGLDVGAAVAAGFAPSVGDIAGRALGNLASPGALTGLAGNLTAKAAGFSPPTGLMGRFAKAVNPVVGLGLGLMNPLAGLGYSFAAPYAMDALGDATNSRRDEKHRDALENAHGTFGGRAAARDFDAMAVAAGFGTLGKMATDYGYSPTDLARGMSNRDASKAMDGRNPSGSSYGGFGAMGGPVGGASAVDRGYGRSMGGYAGLGIGNPSSYGGGGNSSGGGSGGKSGGGGYGGHAGGKDGSSTGFGR